MIVKGLCISDIHFGLPQSQRFYDELSIVKDYIAKNKLDVIFINGDYFDRKLSFNEPAALIAMQFFYELRELCIKKKIKLRLIHGTLSHERNQIEMFNKFASPYLDMKIFNTVTEEELFPGFNVLYVPEEYPVNAEEYYREARSKEYSAMMMHCMWDFIAIDSMLEQANRTDFQTAPIFIYEEWKNCIKHGFAACGHIHKRHIYKKKIFYPGSFSSWDFTDISERGFLTFSYDTEKKYYNVQFVDNTLCPTFGTIKSSDLGLNLNECSVEDIKSAIEPLSEQYDYFRLDIVDMPSDKLELVKRMYKDNPKIKLKIEEKKSYVTTTKDDKFAKYEYIFKNTLPVEEVVARFIKEELSEMEGAENITPEQIKDIITKEGSE